MLLNYLLAPQYFVYFIHKTMYILDRTLPENAHHSQWVFLEHWTVNPISEIETFISLMFFFFFKNLSIIF